MVQHVRHAALAARERERQHRPHHRPAQPGSLGDRQVDVPDRRLAVRDHVQRLAPQGLLEAVGDEARHLAVHRDDGLARHLVEAGGPGDRRRVGAFAADDLDERDEVGRVERVSDDQARGVRGRRLHVRHRIAGGGGGDDDAGRRRRVQAGQQVTLEVELLGSALLDELGVGHGLFQGVRDGQPVRRRALGETEGGERRPRRVDQAAQPAFGVGRGVPGGHVVAAGQEVGDPAAADDSGADAGDTADVLGCGRPGCVHEGVPSSSGRATGAA